MVEGKSGILACSPPWDYPKWEPSKRKLTWPNGAMATTYSADEPERLRGPQHHLAWVDELCSFKKVAAWDNLMLGLRLGDTTRVVVTTTPKPTKLLLKLYRDPDTALTRGSTYENAANLGALFMNKIKTDYEGTRLGRQELYAEVLEDVEGALWNTQLLEECRWPADKLLPVMRRIVVAVDPAGTASSRSDETGIVVCGLTESNEGFVLADLSMRGSPETWGRAAVRAYHAWHADRIIAEVNNGGDMVETVIRMVDRNVAYKAVRASKGKYVRAEPVAALYEQHRVWHATSFPVLEEQMCSFTPDMDLDAFGSPDHADAAIWGLTDLIVENQLTGLIDHYRKEVEAQQADREKRLLEVVGG